MARKLPPTASVARPDGDTKLIAPAATRNAKPLTSFLADHAPTAGNALEIASGTGQHICSFAEAFPDIGWRPTDVDPDRLKSIDAYAAESGLPNIHPAAFLDATKPGWAVEFGGQNLIVLVNLLHLVSVKEVQTIISEVSKALLPGGSFVIYGPFTRNNVLVSGGDMRFDAELRAADPEIGYKDTQDIAHWLSDAGLKAGPPYVMPANNLAFVSQKES